MKLTSIVNVAIFNAVALILAVLVYDDRLWRLSYFHSEGFTTTTTYYPFFYITSATRGSTYIAGLLTVDWLQVVIVVTVIVDAVVAYGVLRRPRENESSPNV